MATRTKGGRKKDVYLELISQVPLRPLRSEAELDRAIAMVDALLDRDELDRDEQDYLDVLSDLIERYESEAYPIAPVSDAQMLRHLLEAKRVTQADVARATAIAESTISEILAGKRSLNRSQIGKLAGYFHVGPGVFAFEPVHEEKPPSADECAPPRKIATVKPSFKDTNSPSRALREGCMDLDDVLDLLSEFHQRATYGAVGDLLGIPAQSVMAPRPRDRRHSWVVSKRTKMPTGYQPDERDPALLERSSVISDPQALRGWLRNPQ